jgi:hypothetical protein
MIEGMNQFKQLDNLPLNLKKMIYAACKPIRYERGKRIMMMEEKIENIIDNSAESLNFDTGMYFICSGEVLILNSHKGY